MRSNAALALGAPHSYGGLFQEVWSAVVQGLENSEQQSDFSEFKHVTTLRTQVCVCVGGGGGGGGTTTISDYVVIFCDFVVVLYCLPYAGSDGRRTGCVVPTSNSRETPPRVPH